MRRTLTFVLAIAALAALAGTSEASSGGSREAVRTVAAAGKVPTVRIAGPQHWCGTNGITCSDPATNWDEIAGYQHAVAQGAPSCPTSATTSPWSSSSPTARARATTSPINLRLPKDPPTRPRQDGSGGNCELPAAHHVLVRHAAVRRPGLAEPATAPRLTGHATVPCKPDSDANIYASPNPNSPRYFGLGPGPGLHGDAVLPAGLGRPGRPASAATRRSGARR